MRRIAWVAAGVTAIAVSTTGCAGKEFEAYEYRLEVTGTAATSISVTVPSRDPQPYSGTSDVPVTTLPFEIDGVASVQKTGPLTLRVMPKAGDATCRIVVEGREAAKRTGPAGSEIVCTTTLEGVK